MKALIKFNFKVQLFSEQLTHCNYLFIAILRITAELILLLI